MNLDQTKGGEFKSEVKAGDKNIEKYICIQIFTKLIQDDISKRGTSVCPTARLPKFRKTRVAKILMPFLLRFYSIYKIKWQLQSIWSMSSWMNPKLGENILQNAFLLESPFKLDWYQIKGGEFKYEVRFAWICHPGWSQCRWKILQSTFLFKSS